MPACAIPTTSPVGGFARDGSSYCFCGHCLRAGLDRGIDPACAREGYLALYRLAHGEDDPDGGSGLVAFLRLLVIYPEILARERLWQDGYQAMQQQLYGTRQVPRAARAACSSTRPAGRWWTRPR
jgi:hypothetical protein